MNAFTELKDASLGWLDLIAGRPGAAGKFTFTRAALINAIGCFIVAALAGIVISGLVVGFPGPVGTGISVVLNLVPLGAMLLCVLAFGNIYKFPVLGPMVVGTYGLAFVLLITLVLSLIAGGTFSNAMLGVFGFMLFRLGRGIADLRMMTALLFAVTTLLALVLIPFILFLGLTGGQGI